MAQENEALPRRHMMTREQAAAIVYHDLKEHQRACFAVSAEYGRWLIASLVLINGGALWGIFSYLGSVGLRIDGAVSDPLSTWLFTLGERGSGLRHYTVPVWCFIGGITLAMLSGLAAWSNWSLHADNYARMARYDMLWDPEKWADEPPYRTSLAFTYWMSIVAGVGSLIAGIVGGAFILHGNFLAGA